MDIKLVDGTSFVNTEKKSVDLFSYSRKYSNTKWLTTILPVAFDYSDWSSRFEIAEITGINAEVEDGVLKSFTYEKTILKSGSKTKPNHPYLIRAKKANTSSYQVLSKTNCEVFPTTSIDNIELISEDFKFVISGTYSKIEYPDLDYYMSGETWKPAVSSSTVGPFRSFICIDIVEDQINPDPNDLVPVSTTVDYQSLVDDNSIVIGKLTINDREVEIKIPAVTVPQTTIDYKDLSGSNSVVIGRLTINDKSIDIKTQTAVIPQTTVSYKDLSGSNSVVIGKLTINDKSIDIKAQVPSVVDNSVVINQLLDTIKKQEERIKSLEERFSNISISIVS